MSYPQSSADDAPEKNATASGVTPSPNFPEIETEVLEFWKKDGTFRASIDNRADAEEWVFYDGPPFANGLPHYGHLLTGYAKDVFPRYQTMRGRKVERRFGWDTHGLPAELEAERQLGITDKSEIEKMGIAAFNQAARDSVLRYTKEWQGYVTRQARWVDFENDYKTLDVTFMESVIWAFKQLHEKGLAYEGYRVLPYCWRDQTPLSNHELRMDDDVYKMRQDQTVTVTFPLTGVKAESLGLTAVRALAWTTTPWTLPTNFALAVGPDIRYAILPAGPNGAADGHGNPEHEDFGAEYLLAIDLVGGYAKDLGYESAADAVAAISRTILGSELEDVTYDRLWDYYADVGRRHGHRAPGAGVRRRRPARLRGSRHPGDHLGRRWCAVPVRGSGCRGPAGLRGEQAAHEAAARGGAPAPPGELRAFVPALLALPESADLQGGLQLVRARHRDP
jgi:isoleucyl-tRNA synthetase